MKNIVSIPVSITEVAAEHIETQLISRVVTTSLNPAHQTGTGTPLSHQHLG